MNVIENLNVSRLFSPQTESDHRLSRLQAVSLFFLVRGLKRARHANDHASDAHASIALPSLTLKKERDCSQSTHSAERVLIG